MYMTPERIVKLKIEGIPHKNIARKIRKRSHTVKSWLYGKDYHVSRNRK